MRFTLQMEPESSVNTIGLFSSVGPLRRGLIIPRGAADDSVCTALSCLWDFASKGTELGKWEFFLDCCFQYTASGVVPVEGQCLPENSPRLRERFAKRSGPPDINKTKKNIASE